MIYEEETPRKNPLHLSARGDSTGFRHQAPSPPFLRLHFYSPSKQQAQTISPTVFSPTQSSRPIPTPFHPPRSPTTHPAISPSQTPLLLPFIHPTKQTNQPSNHNPPSPTSISPSKKPTPALGPAPASSSRHPHLYLTRNSSLDIPLKICNATLLALTLA